MVPGFRLEMTVSSFEEARTGLNQVTIVMLTTRSPSRGLPKGVARNTAAHTGPTACAQVPVPGTARDLLDLSIRPVTAHLKKLFVICALLSIEIESIDPH